MSELGSVSVRFTANISNLTQGLNKVQSEMGGLSSKLAGLGTMVAQTFAGIGAAVTAGLGASVKAAADFEQGLADIKAVSGATGEEMSQLKQLALDMGAETKYSASEAAKGIEELIKAGVGVSDIMGGGLKGALSLATAGGLELADAAEIASTALNAFKSDNLEVMDAANILAGAANASATSVGELKYGLSSVSAVAASVGLSFEDTSTALAVFAQNGLKGSDAGTSLKTMLMSLQPTTKDQIRLFKELGLSAADGSSKFFDSNGQLKSMADIADLLQNSMGHLTDAQRLMAMETIFGSDAIRASNILFKEGAEGIKKMNAEMSKVTADQVAAEKMNTLKGAIEQMKGAIETAGIVLGEAFLPVIRKVAEGVDKFFSTLTKSGQVKEFADGIQRGFGIAKQSGQSFFEYMEPALKNLQDVFKKFVDLVSAIWGEWGDEIVSIMKTAWETVTGVLENVFGIIEGILDVFIGLFTGNWQQLGDGLQEIWTNLWDGVVRILKGADKILLTVFGGIGDSIRKWFTDLTNDALDYGKNLISMFIDGIKSKFGALRDIVSSAMEIVSDFMGFNSPTEKGPASDSDMWSPNFVKMFASGIENELPTIQAAVNKMALNLNPVTAMPAAAGFTPPMPSSNVRGNGASIHIENLQISGSNGEEIWEKLETKLKRWALI